MTDGAEVWAQRRWDYKSAPRRAWRGLFRMIARCHGQHDYYATCAASPQTLRPRNAGKNGTQRRL